MNTIDLTEPYIDRSLIINHPINKLNFLDFNEIDVNYTNVSGEIEIISEVADYESFRLKYKVDKNQILLTNGADQALCLTIRTICENKFDEVMIFSPFYYKYKSQIELFRNNFICIDTIKHKFDINIDNFLKSITRKTKAVIINTPNNPTGLIYKEDKIKEIFEELVNRKIHIIFDVVYRDLIFEEKDVHDFRVPNVPGLANFLWIVNSFSKSFCLPGLRLGLLITPHEFYDKAKFYMKSNTSCISVISQNLIKKLVFFDNSNIIKNILENRNLIFNFIKKNMPDLLETSPFPKAGIYYFMNLNSISNDDAALRCILHKNNLTAMAGEAFGANSFLRIPMTYNKKTLLEALNIIYKTYKYNI